MSVEFWIIVSIITYSLSTTSITLRKMGYLKAADVIDIILTFGAAAMMKAKEELPKKEATKSSDSDDDLPPPAYPGSSADTYPPRPTGSADRSFRTERRGMLVVGALVTASMGLSVMHLLQGCGASEEAIQEVVKPAQGVSSGMVIVAPLVVEGYRAAQKVCLLEAQGNADVARACVDRVRAQWKPVGEVYGDVHEVRCAIESERPECKSTSSSSGGAQ